MLRSMPDSVQTFYDFINVPKQNHGANIDVLSAVGNYYSSGRLQPVA